MAGKLKILSKELQDKFTDPNLTVDQLSNVWRFFHFSDFLPENLTLLQIFSCWKNSLH